MGAESIGFNDPHFQDQWYLVNRGQTGGTVGYDLNVLPVWRKGITGRGVVVSILDDGIDHSHPDLAANYDQKASADLNDRSDVANDPSPNLSDPSNNHGTRCAGEVAARANNSNCGVGIAYNAQIGGVRMLDGPVTDLLEAEAVTFNNQYVDIYSASWGPTDDGKTMEGPHRYCSQAFEMGVKKGRRGLGSIFVWATGNGGLVNDYCSCDGYVSSIYTLSVGSIMERGLSTYFSEICPSTMAVVYAGGSHVIPGDVSYVAPSIKVVTTDVGGQCTTDFQGTSSAAPLAAGCVALVLEANPTLTWRDVQHIVVETAKIPNKEEDGWTVNGGGYHVNHRFGFGVLDCARMVEAAQSWSTVQEQHVCRVESRNPVTKLYAHGTANQSLSTDGCQGSQRAIDHLEHVRVHVEMEYERRGDVSIVLISPSGTQSKLLSRRPLDASPNGINFTFMTVHSWGENPAGRWILSVSDAPGKNARQRAFSHQSGSSKERGRLVRWSLMLSGISGKRENHRETGDVRDARQENGEKKGDKYVRGKNGNDDEIVDNRQAHSIDAEEVESLMTKELRSSESVSIATTAENRKKVTKAVLPVEEKSVESHEQEEAVVQEEKDFEFLRRLFEAEKAKRGRTNAGSSGAGGPAEPSAKREFNEGDWRGRSVYDRQNEEHGYLDDNERIVQKKSELTRDKYHSSERLADINQVLKEIEAMLEERRQF